MASCNESICVVSTVALTVSPPLFAGFVCCTVATLASLAALMKGEKRTDTKGDAIANAMTNVKTNMRNFAFIA